MTKIIINGTELETEREIIFDEEQVVAFFNTGLAVGDDFFSKHEYMTSEDLLPAFHDLYAKCDGVVKKPGIYEFRIIITKMK